MWNELKFETGKKYQYRPQVAINKAGIRLINTYLTEKYADKAAEQDKHKLGFIPRLKELDEGPGGYAKKVANAFWKKYQISLTNEDKEKIGSFAANNAFLWAVDYDFTQNFNWNPGDFGDRDSCFWSGREDARDAIRDAGGYALRLYLPSDFDPVKNPCGINTKLIKDDRREIVPGMGMARAWVIPKLNDDPPGIVVFNGYGKQFGLQTQQVVQVLLYHLQKYMPNMIELDYTTTDLYNYGTKSGTVWINHDVESYRAGYQYDAIAFVVTEEEHLSKFKIYDLMIGDDEDGDEDNDDYRYCDHCEGRYWYDDMYRVGDDILCSGCYEDMAFHCDGCHQHYYNEDMLHIHGRRDDMCYCDTCASSEGFVCDDCHELFTNTLRGLEDDRHVYCVGCSENYFRCEECDDLHHLDDLCTIERPSAWGGDVTDLCGNCLVFFATCETCGLVMDSREDEPEIHSLGGDNFCPHCYFEEIGETDYDTESAVEVALSRQEH